MGSEMCSKDFEVFWQLYEAAFPTDERRSLEQQRQLMRRPEYHVELLYAEGAPVGFWARWEFDAFLYIEHIALDPGHRGAGVGSRFFEGLFRSTAKPVVLEVERDDTAERRRRIAFYERAGMHLNRYPYIQPPLQAGTHAVPMYLFSWPAQLDHSGYRQSKALLYRSVYGVPENWQPVEEL